MEKMIIIGHNEYLEEFVQDYELRDNFPSEADFEKMFICPVGRQQGMMKSITSLLRSAPRRIQTFTK
ncbi:unnamed protein product [Thelazia callipaeda]|uniref:Phosphohistidine phosphatase SixA n=1 Tax=Thelazia callipaeda TaxID=103827 RepID=A0A0N5CQ73_THECL|nr:unnamed protein product [Thelazia callipaeda]